MNEAHERRLCGVFAELLSYPGGGVAEIARRARVLAQDGGDAADRGEPDAADALARFCRHVEASDVRALQELYTAAFDLQPACAPYVGHMLLGEDSPLRGPFLAKLAEIYRGEGFAPREELADHVAEVLRFLATGRGGVAREELLRDGLQPALRRMIDTFEDARHPYRDLLVAVHGNLSSEADGADVAMAHRALAAGAGHDAPRKARP
jgi:nitrate reductase delta subunit